jgi:hypothetical protein
MNESCSRSMYGAMATMLTIGTTVAFADLPFTDGANSLVAGHSFFAPVADAFDSIATNNGYSSHHMEVIFRSGPLGSPASLWSDNATRNQMIDALSGGDIDLFGLTSFVGIGSSFEDYQLWFDTALRYNPNTTFFVGNPWMPGGARTETQAYNQAIEQSDLNTFAIVEDLREAYPDNEVIYIAYGKTASVMKTRYEAGELPDIQALLPDPANGVSLEDALFEDNLGHGGADDA